MSPLILLPFLPMFLKHAWTAANAPRGRYPRGPYAGAAALYEAAFWLWALTLGVLTPLAALMAAVHLAGVPLYFGGYLSRYSRYGRHYAVFEAVELATLVALLAALM